MQNHSFISKPENQQADECVICEQPRSEHREFAIRFSATYGWGLSAEQTMACVERENNASLD